MLSRLISLLGLIGMTALCVCAAVCSAQTNLPQTYLTGGYRVAGTVVSKTDAHPLSHARITLGDAKGAQKPRSAITADDGKFEFLEVAAGKYSLSGAKRGFISAGYDQHDQYSTAIVTGAGLDTETLTLKLAPTAIIAGKVLDESGEPVRNAMVTLYYDNHSEGVDQIHQMRSERTDDLGAYEISRLMPGTYFLSASATPWYAVHPSTEAAPHMQGRNAGTADRSQVNRTLDVAYPTTYYADTTEADSATPIPVRGGEHVEVDIHLNPVPALHLLFRIPGDGTHGFSFPQLQQPAFDGSTFVQAGATRMVSPGLVEVTGIAAGRYNVRMNGPGPATQMNDVDLTKDGEEIDSSSSPALASVKISLQVPEEAAVPARLTVGLRQGHRQITAAQAVDAKGEGVLQQIAAGRYEVLVWGPARRYSITRMAAEGGEVSGHTLTVAAGASPSVSLTLASGSGEVQGTVTRAGKGFSGAMVVLVPRVPEGNHDLFRRDQSDLDGTFSLRGVIPGSYTVLAIENGWDLDWSQPGVIAVYLKLGRAIEVAGGRPVNLAEPIEVQAK
jgi:Carboxypeptidase regulatory-like domain